MVVDTLRRMTSKKIIQRSPSFEDSSNESSSASTSVPEPSQASDPELARKESTAVNRTKGVVYLVILVFAIALAVWSHFHLKQQESAQFKAAYESVASAFLDGSERNALQIFSRLDLLSKAISSHAEAWPKATLPNFDVRTTLSVESDIEPELYLFAPIVSSHAKRDWEEYAWSHQNWIEEDLALRGLDGSVDPGKIPRRIQPFFPDDEYDLDEIDVYVPLWQVGPTPTDASILLLDLYTHPSFRRTIDDALDVRHSLLSEVVSYNFLTESIQTLDKDVTRTQEPRSYGLQPVYDGPEDTGDIVGFLFAMIRWDTFFVNILSDANGLVVDVKDTCGSDFSYLVNGPLAEYYENSWRSESINEEYIVSREFAEFARFQGVETRPFVKHCSYKLVVHATQDFKAQFQTYRPIIYPIVLVGVFVFTAIIFALYDSTVQRRNDTIMDTATRTTALVSSLFPKEVQDRIMNDGMKTTEEEEMHMGIGISMKRQSKESFHVSGPDGPPARDSSPPIANLYPSASVIFADMTGFTSWSSTREPSQVFYLLETIYNAFDDIARARRVFKVETIGDCWMGACGLPEPRKNHAVAICRFAKDIVGKMSILVRELEVKMGPDTADLGIRVGVHSGQVTAGVLRGTKVRFQLFGDTVNVASRMESTGAKNRIQISAETKQCLAEAGKAHWAVAREDKVVAKGKGELQTYWLNVGQAFSQSSRSSQNTSEEEGEEVEHNEFEIKRKKKLSRKDDRLVQWNTELLMRVLKRMQDKRQLLGVRPDPEKALKEKEQSLANRSTLVVDELQEIISLPDWKRSSKSIVSMELDHIVKEQLLDFVSRIALMYRDNGFHNFAHASHVTMSVTKLFSRIIHPSDLDHADDETLYDYTYGLTSDPLVEFSLIFSALIHDVEHPGVPNAVLVSESDPLARKYQGKSPAEQHSVDCAWSVLLEDKYLELRRAIYCTKEEFDRFRQLVVICVVSTDICDKQLGAARKERWNAAFADSSKNEESSRARNRKATIVLEHLIQASDVSHTMQHWQVYRRWNECFFVESVKAYESGRTSTDPVENWYSGELGFFDFYVIPTAKKLAECGVFGVSSDEYLNYAIANRNEWESRGREIVKEMAERHVGSMHTLDT